MNASRHIIRLTKCLLPACVLIFAFLPAADAGSWLFRRSYFSHELPPEVAIHHPQPQSRSAYRRAIPSQNPGYSIRGGYRYNTTVLRGAGTSRDVTIEREFWFQHTP